MPKIQLVLAGSKTLFSLFSFLYGGAVLILLIAMYQADWWWGWSFLLLIACVISGYYHFQLHIFRSLPSAIVKITYLEALSCWELQQRNGQLYSATLCTDSVLTSQLIILRFKVKNALFHRAVIVDPYAVDGDVRQLRKWWLSYK